MFIVRLVPVFAVLAVCIVIFEVLNSRERHFWYPIELFDVKCELYEGEVYRMTNSRGWRSYPYYLSRETKSEIILSESCIFISKRKLIEYERNIEERLNEEQKEYLIEGF